MSSEQHNRRIPKMRVNNFTSISLLGMPSKNLTPNIAKKIENK
tara:strand:- start:638 stop:766 length:129 start_codon:yes stop_codon:yes gene_type:complete